jgi:hypothetical protein
LLFAKLVNTNFTYWIKGKLNLKGEIIFSYLFWIFSQMLFWLLAISLIEKYGQKGRWGCNVKYLTSNGKWLYMKVLRQKTLNRPSCQKYSSLFRLLTLWRTNRQAVSTVNSQENALISKCKKTLKNPFLPSLAYVYPSVHSLIF